MGWKLIDLFCGAGGMAYGFVDKKYCGSFDCVAAVDNDAASVATHAANIDGPAVHMGIEEWLESGDIPEADVVIGGPPCQGFSLLNKQRQGDERRALWEPFLDVVDKSGASIFVMENVAELYRSPELQDIKAKADKMGFSTTEAVLNTADYGVPQTRRRTIVLGWKRMPNRNAPLFPPMQSHRSPNISSNLPEWLTVGDTIRDLPEPTGTEIFGDNVNGLHFGRRPTAKSLARYKVVPPGGNRFDLEANAPEITPDCWKRKKSGGTDLFGRLWWHRPSVTIRTEFFKPEKGRYLHPEEHRPITHCEAALLMGFPPTYQFKGSKTEVARQIGNAVPPPFANALGEMVVSIFQPMRKTA